MRTLIIIITVLLFQSCSQEQETKIVITKDYISNKHWDDERNNAILIERMKVKNGDILDASSPDFNKDNGFYWNFGCTYYDHKKTDKNTIGSLENNTWYKFSDLKTMAYYVYIYVDDEGKVHRFNVNMSNF
jgi:major membrane immunogen (membrane-anchored lipoprotein)